MARVIVAPMPTAAPLIAAITGLGRAWMARVTRPPVSRTPSAYAGSSKRSRIDSGVGSSGLVEAEDVALGRQVHAGAERTPGAGDHDGTHGVVAARRW